MPDALPSAPTCRIVYRRDGYTIRQSVSYCQHLSEMESETEEILRAVRRIAKRLSPRKVADMSGVSHSTVYRILDEDSDWEPQAETLGKLEAFVTQWDNGDRQTVSRETNGARISEPAPLEPYAPSSVLAAGVPSRVYEVALSYLKRLERANVPHDDIATFERLLLDRRYAVQYRSSHGEEMSEDDQILHIDIIWDAISTSLHRRGVRP